MQRVLVLRIQHLVTDTMGHWVCGSDEDIKTSEKLKSCLHPHILISRSFIKHSTLIFSIFIYFTSSSIYIFIITFTYHIQSQATKTKTSKNIINRHQLSIYFNIQILLSKIARHKMQLFSIPNCFVIFTTLLITMLDARPSLKSYRIQHYTQTSLEVASGPSSGAVIYTTESLSFTIKRQIANKLYKRSSMSTHQLEQCD